MILTKGLSSYIFPIKHEQPNPEVYTSIIDEIMAFLAKRAYYLAKKQLIFRKKAHYLAKNVSVSTMTYCVVQINCLLKFRK